MTTDLVSRPEIRTTHASIAMMQLHGQIEGLEQRSARGEMLSDDWATLVDLLVLRAQIVGRIADYEHAAQIAELRAIEAPEDGAALLSRARTRSSLHRFAEAEIDCKHAAKLGAPTRQVDAAIAALHQATGRYEEALATYRRLEDEKPDFESAGNIASLLAEMGERSAAEHWFETSCERYRSVSPFAIAQLEFQRGHMWFSMDRNRARHWFLTATRRLPCYAHAEGHLAELEFALGDADVAIARLERLAAAADDPDYASELSLMLREMGREAEAISWRNHAEKRYEDLIARHPAAYADHGARFWLHVGGNPKKALDLALLNLAVRDTPRARNIVAAAQGACAAK